MNEVTVICNVTHMTSTIPGTVYSIHTATFTGAVTFLKFCNLGPRIDQLVGVEGLSITWLHLGFHEKVLLLLPLQTLCHFYMTRALAQVHE